MTPLDHDFVGDALLAARKIIDNIPLKLFKEMTGIELYISTRQGSHVSMTFKEPLGRDTADGLADHDWEIVTSNQIIIPMEEQP